MDFRDVLEKNFNINSLIMNDIGEKPKSTDWEVMNLIPEPFPVSRGHKPDDALSAVYQSFKKNTNIPIELPVFSLLAYVSAYLVKNECKVKVAGEKNPMELNLWLMNLASSGSSKTWSKSHIQGSVPLDVDGNKKIEPTFDEPAGPAAFVDELKDNPRGFYIQDECGQLIKQMENFGTPASEMKKYLLLSYDGSKIVRKTKKEKTEVENPVLTLLWINTIQGFLKAISEESMYDGFCQRFLYVYAVKDQERTMEDYQRYNSETIAKDIDESINKLFRLELNEQYEVDADVAQYWEEGFKFISINHFQSSVNESFFRRVLWSCWKYSVIFHVVLGKETKNIDFEDMKYALKAALFHLHSLESFLKAKKEGYEDEVDKGKKVILKVKEYIESLEANNKSWKTRDIQRKFTIKTADEAKELIKLAGFSLG